MAELFAFDTPIQSDQITRPNVSTTELKNALALVYNHLHRHRINHLNPQINPQMVSTEKLVDALDKMAECANNENWVIYTP